jgi:hypothetical protein
MTKNDFGEFCEAWLLAQELGANGKVYSKSAMVELFEMLVAYPLDEIKRALRKHRFDNKFAPILHDILAILGQDKPQHIPADEAWAIALQSMDEAETVIVTDQILQARTVAWGIYAENDLVGARMAFRAAYERAIQTAPQPVWRVSLGHDKQRRADALTKAVERGQLPHSELAILENLEKSTLTVQQLIQEIPEQSANQDSIVKKLDELRALLTVGEDDQATARERNRQDFERKRDMQLKRVAKRLGEIH